MTEPLHRSRLDIVPSRSYVHAGPKKPHRKWIMTKQSDPPSLGPCPYCVETVRKAGGKYLDLDLGPDSFVFVPHRHQPQKAQAEPDPMRASPGESSGD